MKGADTHVRVCFSIVEELHCWQNANIKFFYEERRLLSIHLKEKGFWMNPCKPAQVLFEGQSEPLHIRTITTYIFHNLAALKVVVIEMT